MDYIYCKEICSKYALKKDSYSGTGVTPETQSTCWMMIIYRVHNRETSKED